MTKINQDVEQQLLEFERQKYRMQKEFSEFAELEKRLQDIEKKAQQGDLAARHQMQQVDIMANGPLGTQMKQLMQQLRELQTRMERLNKIQTKVVQNRNHSNNRDDFDSQTKIKKKRRIKIKYL